MERFNVHKSFRQWWLKRQAARVASILAVFTLVLSACAGEEKFLQTANTESFVQEYNPHYLEVLWVLDDRSPMRNHRTALVNEARDLFTRIDGALGEFGQYKMAITNMDARPGRKGLLKPASNPAILRRGTGSLTDRLNHFSSIFFPLLNLETSASNRGFETSLAALTQAPFSSDPRVPLVLVYLSFGDDRSASEIGDPVEEYAQKLLDLKNGNPDLLRVYAANYLPLSPGVTPTKQTRCARLSENEIDGKGSHVYEDRYFRLAQRLAGEVADLCASGFAQTFNLNGLQLKVLPKRFALQGYPDPNTIQITILRDGQSFPGFTWTFDPSTREIVFDETPPQGTKITVTYLPFGRSQTTN